MFRHDLKNQLGRAGRSIRETQAAGPVDFGSGILNFGFIVCNAPAGDDSAGPLGTHLPILDLGFWISDFRSGLRLQWHVMSDTDGIDQTTLNDSDIHISYRG